MMSESSRLPVTFAAFACSAFSTLPRSGRIACVFRSRPCFAEPPAESPSTMKSSEREGSVDEQSASLPGRFSRCDTAVLRVTSRAAARRSRNAVHVRAHVLVGRLGPHERELEPGLALAREVERASRRGVAALLNDVREPVRKAPFVSELVAPRRLLGLVEENDAEATMEVRLGLEALADLPGVEGELPEDLGVRPEAHRRARPAHFLAARDLLDLRRRLATGIRLPPFVPVPFDRDGHLRRERADD